MKPTPGQLIFLRKYLHQNLEFRETYIEFYDHILTALENEADDIPFERTVQNIIQNDFGGFEGVAGIERSFKINATRQLQHKYANCMMGYFKRPAIGITLLLGLLLYLVAMQPWFGFWLFVALVLLIRLSTGSLRALRHIRSGYFFKSKLKSVKDYVFIWLDNIPVMFFIMALIAFSFGNTSPVTWFKHVHPLLPVLFLEGMVLHAVAYYNVYDEEFSSVLT